MRYLSRDERAHAAAAIRARKPFAVGGQLSGEPGVDMAAVEGVGLAPSVEHALADRRRAVAYTVLSYGFPIGWWDEDLTSWVVPELVGTTRTSAAHRRLLLRAVADDEFGQRP